MVAQGSLRASPGKGFGVGAVWWAQPSSSFCSGVRGGSLGLEPRVGGLAEPPPHPSSCSGCSQDQGLTELRGCAGWRCAGQHGGTTGVRPLGGALWGRQHAEGRQLHRDTPSTLSRSAWYVHPHTLPHTSITHHPTCISPRCPHSHLAPVQAAACGTFPRTAHQCLALP